MSKPVVVTIPHELGRAEARRRIDTGLDQLVGQIGAIGNLERAWDGDTLRFSLVAISQAISGSVAVHEHEARLEILLPGLFGMIANKLKGRLKQEGQILLGGPRKA